MGRVTLASECLPVPAGAISIAATGSAIIGVRFGMIVEGSAILLLRFGIIAAASAIIATAISMIGTASAIIAVPSAMILVRFIGIAQAVAAVSEPF